MLRMSEGHLIWFEGSDSWFRKLEAGVHTVRFQGSVFVVRILEDQSHDQIFRTDKQSSI